MSSILKRKSFSENSGDKEGDSGEELEVKKAKMAQNKTPVSLLHEMCSKENEKPKFEELPQNHPEIKDYLRSAEKKFWIKCSALKRSAIQGGPTKKSAQHAAAQIVIQKVEMNTDESEDEVEKVNKGDYVTDLLNLCVLRNYEKPQFKCIDSYGPSHDPSFVYECRLNTIVRTATANNKNQSKQMAAKEVFEIMRASFPDMEKKVKLINERNLVKEESRRKITTYLKMKEIDKLDTLGSTVADRSNYFLRHHNSDFINALKAVLGKEDTDENTKYKELVKELETMWKCNVEDFFGTGLKQFECKIDFEQFTVSLVAPPDQIPKEVINYFSEMLNIPCH